jgi:hypothetical protein
MTSGALNLMTENPYSHNQSLYFEQKYAIAKYKQLSLSLDIGTIKTKNQWLNKGPLLSAALLFLIGIFLKQSPV